MTEPRIHALGDSAITVSLGETISLELSQRALGVAKSIAAAGLPGITEVVPSYASVGVFYDALAIGYDDIVSRIRSILAESAVENDSAAESRLIRIPVRYDGEDLDTVAERTSLRRDEVIAIHSSREYRVFVLGFVPGFAYLGELDRRLVLPRRDVPRKRVQPGSVAIAEAQTGVYPSATPGGWHLLGTTTEILFDVRMKPPALLRVGDRVVFEPVAM